MKNLTNKTWFIYYKGFQIWLSEEEANAIKPLMSGDDKTVEIAGRILPLKDIALLKGEDNDRAEKLRRGYWMCEYGYFHEKNNECGHNLISNKKIRV